MLARRVPATDEDRHKEEVAALLALFHKFVNCVCDREGQWESLEELMEARADFLFRHSFDGFGLTYEEAIDLIRNSRDLTDEQEAQRISIIAAVDNLADFAVVEEYQMAQDIEDEIEEIEENLTPEEIEDMEAEDWLEMLLPLFSKYNDRYALVENLDVEYAMSVAAYLSSLKNNTTLMYMTMGDERVRPWHLQYEGFTARKSEFPEWLIPPIEHQCRCYLVEDTNASTIGAVKAQKSPKMPDWFNKTFKESVAKGGRIFSDEHPYFQVDERHMVRLKVASKRIKSKMLGDGED